MEELLVREFDGLQDVHSAVWRLSAAANAALGLWLDILSALFILCVTFSFIYMFEGKILIYLYVYAIIEQTQFLQVHPAATLVWLSPRQ